MSQTIENPLWSEFSTALGLSMPVGMMCADEFSAALGLLPCGAPADSLESLDHVLL